MKRYISILLALILAASCGMLTAVAESDYRDPAEWPTEPVIHPRLNPALHPKLTPALLKAIEAAEPADTEQNLMGLHIVAYLSEAFDAIDKMPSWPDYAANNEYPAYVSARKSALVAEAFGASSAASFGRQYADWYMPGCLILRDVNLDDVMLCERSASISRIDVFDPVRQTGKLDSYMTIALNVFDPDDYIPVWVGNAAHMKNVDEMPSWPSAPCATLGETQEQLSKARSEYSAYKKEFNDAFVAEAFDGIEAVVYDGYGFMAPAAVKLSDIETLAARNCVRYIEYNINPIAETEDPLVQQDDPDLSDIQRRLCEQYGITNPDALDYEELHTHLRDQGGQDDPADWVLVRAFRFDLCYATALHSAVVGGRRLTASELGWAPFEFAYGIYDAGQDRFFDLTEIDFDDYDGLSEVWQELILTTPYGRIYEDSPYFDGDADGDGLVSVLDATRIQRVLAGLCTKYMIVATAADVDRDGSVTILDATRIQRYKAAMCNLDGTPRNPDRGEYLYYPDNNP